MRWSDEAALIEGLKQGKPQAVERWYKETKKALTQFFSVKVTHPSDVDELVHDTYLSCLSSLPLFRGSSGLFTYMMSIARHELADYYRKKYAKKVIAALPFGEELLQMATKEHDSTSTEAVTAALNCLPTEVSELLALKYIDGLSLKELATKFNVGVTAMQSKLYRAKLAFLYQYEQIQKGEQL